MKDIHNDVDTIFYIGTDNTNSITKGLKTLFVVGIRNTDSILTRAKKHNCEAIYFGANKSFSKQPGHNEWEEWTRMIKTVLDDENEYYCSLELDVKFELDLLETFLCEHTNFIPVISVQMPYLEQLGYNAIVKIDDIEFNKTNPGTWSHNLHKLTSYNAFTSNKKHKDDKAI